MSGFIELFLVIFQIFHIRVGNFFNYVQPIGLIILYPVNEIVNVCQAPNFNGSIIKSSVYSFCYFGVFFRNKNEVMNLNIMLVVSVRTTRYFSLSRLVRGIFE